MKSSSATVNKAQIANSVTPKFQDRPSTALAGPRPLWTNPSQLGPALDLTEAEVFNVSNGHPTGGFVLAFQSNLGVGNRIRRASSRPKSISINCGNWSGSPSYEEARQGIRERNATECSYIEANSQAAKRTKVQINAIWNHWLQLQSPTVDYSRSAIPDYRERHSCILTSPRHVRFTPNNGHSSVLVGCPLCAISGHWGFSRRALFCTAR